MAGTPQTAAGYAVVNDTKLYYEVAGEGHPLLLIHGGLVDRRLWDDQFSTFAEYFRVIRFDLRAFGNSDVPTQPFSFIEDVRALLEFLGIEKTYIMGLSMGGAIAIDFTLAYPHMVDALIPVASAVSGFQMSEQTLQQIHDIDALVENGDIAEAVELENMLWTDGPWRKPQQVNPLVRAKVYEMNMHNYSLQSSDMPEPIVAEQPALSRLAEISVPTLVIVGNEDLIDIQELAEKITNDIPGAKKMVIPDTAHHLNMEQPALFNHVVLDFLAGIQSQ